ncbi:hypothetical protein PXK17_20045 [Phaeobacter gallaeciensis]|uniref:Phage tail tape measure protein n=1 Tax=Phaeobacter gallaeciensis TaxID=60890 RepID=A0ABD4XG91_9RHOB|nr:hypothetical protein [Phaeobacter gallaeciensis]MDE4146921.1 hypothetical protein [Phaeobacter gallaeciensis]MDE4163770.1 hypothetical protein [Phaeobacter gallaeciensis]MDE4168005.1 hypothetical protein [Phaeobacter gallaeciensis]MDE4172237.1 hypothetical protein [Phaeobacter gallaeciensis]MDE4180758.1 hypothetical protein [Phaeobacter gallaeciensis]
MAAIIGALRGVLSMDSAAFESGAKRAQSTMGKTERRMLRMGANMEKAGRRMSLGLTLPLAGAAAVAVKSSLQMVDAQAKMAQSLGTTVKSMQVLDRAADLSGVSIGEVQQATIQLTKRLSQAAGGSGAAAKALKRLHLNASDLQRLPLDERLARIQGALAEYVPQAERAAVASDLFGSRAGLIFTRIDGATLKLAAEDVGRFGVAISEVDADRLETANDAMSRMGLAGRGLANQLTVALVPAMQTVSDGAASVAEWFNGLGEGTKRVIALGTAGAAALGPLAVGLGLTLKLTAPLGVAMAGMLSTVALAPVRFLAAAKSAVALEMALGATTTRAALGSVAIKGLSRGLVLLRGAVITTGIGALVVGAGYLAMKFHQLVTATGGWGMALQALGDLASGVWLGIKTSARSIGPALGAVWETVKAGFLRMMGTISENWSAFLSGLAVRVKNIPGMSGAFDALNEASGRAFEGVAKYDALAVRAANSSAALKKEAKGLVREGWAKAAAALKTLTLQMDGANAELDAGDDSADALKDSLEDLNDTLDDGSGGGTKDKLDKTKKKAKDLSDELNGPLSSAVDGMARSFGDWVANGLRDFEGLWDGIKQAAKRGLADLASSFAQNTLKIALGLSVTGSGSAASAGTAVLGGGGGVNPLGLLSNVGGLVGGGGIAAGMGSGLGGVLTGGGLGSSFANLGGLVSGASSGWGALGAALPAAGLVLGGLAVLAKGLSRKYAGSGIRGRFGADGFEGSSIDFYKGGFLRSNRTDYKPLEADFEAALDQSVTGLTDGVKDMAASLNLGTKALEGFTSEGFTLWTNGKSQEKIQEELQARIEETGAEMAELVLGTDDFSRAGETALDTLGRLSGSLTAVNDAADLLGHGLFDVSLKGSDAASHLVDLFGGAEAMAGSVSAYFGAFYSEGERTEVILRRLREEFGELGVAMPASRDGFRELVEGIDTTTEHGRELYAGLLQMSGVMAEVLPQVSAYSAELAGMVGEIGGELGAQIEAARARVSEERATAESWRRAGSGLRDLVDGLITGDLTGASAAQAEAAQRARLDGALAAVRSGDLSAAESLPELARAYLQSARAGAGSALEYRRIAAEVQGQLRFAAGVADLESGNDEVLAGLYEQQIEVLTSLGSFLQLEGLTGDQIADLSQGVQDLAADWDGTVSAFETSLGALEDAISQAEGFSYDDLVGALDVAVTLADDAPRWLRRMVEQADSGIRTTLDFIIRRDDLTAADRWIATHALSQHVASLDLVLREDLDRQTRKLVLTNTEELRRKLMLQLGRDLDPDTRALVLTRSANLSRRVNVALTREGGDTVERLTRLQDLIGARGQAGRISFGGAVRLTADTVFSDLASATGDLLQPMENLRAMLGDLRAAVRLDTAERQAQSKVASLQIRGAGLADRTEVKRAGGAELIGQIEDLQASTGVKLLRGSGEDAILRQREDGTIVYRADYTSGGAGLAAFNAAFRGADGLEAKIADYNERISGRNDRLERLRAQIRGLGGIPQFAAGGAHAGGLRIVGERGWEIERTGASRIHSHAESVAMLDNRFVVQSVNALAKQVGVQGQTMELFVRKIAQFLEDWDEAGQPEVRV